MPRAPWEYTLNQPMRDLVLLATGLFPPRFMPASTSGPAPRRSARWSLRRWCCWSLLAASAWCVVRRPALGFVAGSFFLVLSVTSSVVPGVSIMIFEHRMYLSLAAVAMMVVLGGHDLLNFLLPAAAGAPRGG